MQDDNTVLAQVEQTTASTIESNANSIDFSFGEPVPVLDKMEILDYLVGYDNGRWYEPPVSMSGLAKSLHSSAHHSSALFVKRNFLRLLFKKNQYLSSADFAAFALDFLVLGNGYLEPIYNIRKQLIKLKQTPAKYVRRSQDKFFFVNDYKEPHEFDNPLIHIKDYDLNQEIYGIPEYLSALQSAWLNESATLFRRKYYVNGAHAGFILYLTDATQNQDDVNKIKQAFKEAKGPGNFKNMFVYAPNGKKDGIQVLPISEVTAKDEFFNIKSVTRDDVLAGHRVPPQLMSILPSNVGGLGDAKTATEVFYTVEILPLQAKMQEVNEIMGMNIIGFDDFSALGMFRN